LKPTHSTLVLGVYFTIKEFNKRLKQGIDRAWSRENFTIKEFNKPKLLLMLELTSSHTLLYSVSQTHCYRVRPANYKNQVNDSFYNPHRAL
uniref:hypothetical protein n=1 Tax=Helicobacter japonicus TaxID=425400 RepID=UPI0025B3404A